ncbi:MAG: erythrose-4-phosphate dehydrogenase, partial [Litoricolaceae bacterium]|nr:erythrose-4-phosphate dehydrogenase [Litorivicinaceae bacterium]
DLYRARAAGHSMIPTKTGAAAAVGLVLPHLNGRLDGMAVRVPTINVSLVDLTCRLKTQASAEEVNQAIQKAADGSPNGILITNRLPLVSQDFNHNPASSIVDLNHTKVLGDLTKVLAWYDNEWGFSNRMLDTTLSWMKHGLSKQTAA